MSSFLAIFAFACTGTETPSDIFVEETPEIHQAGGANGKAGLEVENFRPKGMADVVANDMMNDRIVADRPGVHADRGLAAGQVPGTFSAVNLSLNNGTIRPVFCDMLDFQRDANGQAIQAGANVESAYSEAGVFINTLSKDAMQASRGIAFDSSNPTGGDADLGTPNSQYGGPGQGSGGASNDTALGNLLIRAENVVDADGDGLVDDPDDHGGGALFIFHFGEDKCVGSAQLVDIEHSEVPAMFLMYGPNDTWLSEVAAGGMGDNSVEDITLDVCGVRRMKVALQSSGAVHDVSICNAPEPATQLFIDMDLLNVTTLSFDLRVTAEDVNGVETELTNARTSMNPAIAVNGGNLLPFPVAINSAIPSGDWVGFNVYMDNIAADNNDGTTTPVPGSLVSTVNAPINVPSCGTTDVQADWYIDARFEGDFLGLGVGFVFDNVTTSYDSTGC